ncbi:MAG: UDP-N-acetylglucosamine 2-epimerase (hydrolyzing) [Candidatus Fermentithermobacillus carboniphilus]|uniref:UDP-N-acetylglucosamine 2-epimerase (Hydrolyzing) n=1 Tax=Candidatus Fermentithermobacillus carboniphilus TaxID=3085328 RepID=A0AAT9LE69_9FIRM|nr:MAG: UDP-N-acetylglucosamine 2-epimerase (hydrolyzing) [Candidatus Fermentithermobacillus carboniphilus]
MRKVCVVTGTRAEYGILRTVMKNIKSSPRLQLQTLVTGMHLSPAYGLTITEIERDGFKIDAEVDMLLSSDSHWAPAKSVGMGILGMTQAFQMLKCEIIVVLGDRVEAFAGAVAASLSNLLLCHIHGGDKSRGGLDEAMRHAITKLAHVHLAASQASAERILRMGESPDRVFVVGAPGLDEIAEMEFMTKEEVAAALNLDLSKPIVTVVQHPVSTEPEEAKRQFRETLEAVRSLDVQAVIICPNSDPGNQSMVSLLGEYQTAGFRVVKSLPRRQYLSLLKISSVLVGNSSSGIIEAPFLGVPVVNVGSRQQGREQPCEILQADYDRVDIAAKMRLAIFDEQVKRSLERIRYVYGNGTAGKQIARILETVPLTNEFKQKTITY